MISIQQIVDTETKTVFKATEPGKLIMLSIVNAEDTTTATINVWKKGNEHQVRIIAKDTILSNDPMSAAYIDNRIIKTGQSIIIQSSAKVEVDINIE